METALRLSIVVPAYNEAARLPVTLPQLASFAEHWGLAEVLIVDDGSRDVTAALVEEFSRGHTCVRLIRHLGTNRGKGHAVRRGAGEAQGDWILCTDADLSSPIEEAQKLFAAITAEDAAVAIGSRAVDRALVGVRQHVARDWSGRLFNLVMRVATGLPFYDTQCGFKLYRRDAARAIFARQRLEGFAFDVEDLFIARRHGFRIVEVPVRWDNVEETRVSALSGARAFLDLLLIRWHDVRGRYR